MTPVAQSQVIDNAVRKSIVVKAGAERAFRVFTEGMDTWWPKMHHIGASPMKKSVLECRAGGRCYSEHEDGTESDWGRVLEVGAASPFRDGLAGLTGVEIRAGPVAV